jgi:hypothetical protein
MSEEYNKAREKLLAANAVKIEKLDHMIQEQATTIRMLVIQVDELRAPFQNSNRHYLYERATLLLNKLSDEGKI